MTVEQDRSDGVDRFSDPLYTASEAARYLGLPSTTFARWAYGYAVQHDARPDTVAGPVVTSLPAQAVRGRTIPFVGLAEGYTLAAIRSSGVSLQRVRPALSRLHEEMGIAHALASRRLFTDGVEVLFDYAARTTAPSVEAATHELVVVRNGQRVLNDVVESYLRRVEFGPDGYAEVLPLPGYTAAELVADPGRGFGHPVFVRGGARLEDVLAMFYGGESLTVVAEEFGVPMNQLEDALRIAASTAA